MWAAPASAISGWIHDESGNPVERASACLMAAGAEILCFETAEDGYWTLPDSDTTEHLLFTADGFLPVRYPAVQRDDPIVLERASSFFIRLLDRDSGSALEAGEISVLDSSGRSHGPFPVNRNGLRMKRFAAGTYRVRAAAPEHEARKGVPLYLRKGEETTLEIHLDAARTEGD